MRPPLHLLPYRRRSAVFSGETVDWGVRLLGAPDIWKLTQGQGVAVAVLDTGSTPLHPDLRGSFIKRGKSFAGRNCAGGPVTDIRDRQGHGTHVSGIIAANRNGLGVVGVAPRAKIVPVKVLGDDGSGSFEGIIAGLRWVIAHRKQYGIRIISMSLGAPVGHPELRAALVAAKAAGIITVCAAGNEGNRTDLGYPARYALEKLCLAVGAVRSDQSLTDFSNTGRGMTRMGVVAPGFEVLSTIPGNRYARFSGTSMATPHIAGVLALAVAKHLHQGGRTPLTNLAQAYAHLRRFTKDLGIPGADRAYGLGLPVLTAPVFRDLRRQSVVTP